MILTRQTGPSARQTSLTASLGRLTVEAIVAVAIIVAVGALTQLTPFRSVDESIHGPTVSALQSWGWLVSISRWLTDMGARDLVFLLTGLLAVLVTLVRRSILHGLLVLATMASTHAVQWVVIAVVDGSVPTENVIGKAGPYYSGGVVRIMVLIGMASAAVAVTRSSRPGRLTWLLALGFGLAEGLTRLVLGRHWPFDVIAAVAIGLYFVWLHVRALVILDEIRIRRRTVEAVSG